ncbi:MAG: F0F1 ATP synthase subunit B [Patescibacteria group bacterium]
MQAIFSTFGIDWRLLIINMVNFGLLLLALWYFLYGPVMKMLEERRQKVADGVRDAESAKQTLQEIEGSRREVLAHAGKEADGIVAEARAAALQKEREILAHGEVSANALVKDAEARAQELKTRAIEESKQEVAKLIVLGMQKAAKPQGSALGK